MFEKFSKNISIFVVPMVPHSSISPKSFFFHIIVAIFGVCLTLLDQSGRNTYPEHRKVDEKFGIFQKNSKQLWNFPKTNNYAANTPRLA